MEKCTFFLQCILFWAGYRATRPFDIASSLGLSSASLCENSILRLGKYSRTVIHLDLQTQCKTQYPPLRFCEARKTSVPKHVQMMNNTPMDLPRKEFQPRLTHASDGNNRITPLRKLVKSLARLSITPVRIIQPQYCFTVTD